jgi:hypothetical protein
MKFHNLPSGLMPPVSPSREGVHSGEILDFGTDNEEDLGEEDDLDDLVEETRMMPSSS